jgi:Outer membrane efflux protein
MKIRMLHILFVWLTALTVQAQPSRTVVIPPLEVVMDSALKRAPLIKAKVVEANIVSEELSLEKKNWMDHIYVEGAANYGMFDQLLFTRAQSGVETSSGIPTRSEQFRYYGGLSIKLPFSAATGRRNKMEIKRLAGKKLNYEMLQLQQELKEIIIEEYYLLIYYESSMETLGEVYQTLNISYLKARKEVENGRMELGEFGLLVSTMGKGHDAFLKARSDFHSQLSKIENLSGIKFESKL